MVKRRRDSKCGWIPRTVWRRRTGSLRCLPARLAAPPERSVTARPTPWKTRLARCSWITTAMAVRAEPRMAYRSSSIRRTACRRRSGRSTRRVMGTSQWSACKVVCASTTRGAMELLHARFLNRRGIARCSGNSPVTGIPPRTGSFFHRATASSLVGGSGLSERMTLVVTLSNSSGA